ncbi:NAD-dependent epimerase/dehydratase family protein [Streptomyces formicae]|uniref:NAD-dependent epimerase/dehydratase family protein n=1 Tax=Streptomyces formicae TaxID=1616117 RepID=A0ABY3WM78_9ACTN|nr:NAD-dependent epimerase/dehydratase family protein [Streptomyces formicae]UNM12765.1 NAD-dependent epimerase/dehydratase family protein [Streptomyces formicae]
MSGEDLAVFASDGGPVLVTGGTGHVGGHTVARLLQKGYRTHVTVREPGREAEALALVRPAGVDPADRLELAVAYVGSDDGWAAAVDGVSHVLHLASPFPFTPPETGDAGGRQHPGVTASARS